MHSLHLVGVFAEAAVITSFPAELRSREKIPSSLSITHQCMKLYLVLANMTWDQVPVRT